MTLKLEGITTALVTPFDEDDQIDELTLRKLIDRQVASNIESVAVVAGCGEYISLSQVEREIVVRISVDQAAGRTKVLAGILDATTGDAARNAARFHQVSDGRLDGLLVLTPYYILPSQSGLQNHYQIISDATPLPIVLYNNPSRTKINMGLDDLDYLSSIQSVVAIKECDRDLGRVAVKIKDYGERLSFLCGDDDLALSSWTIGSVGSIMSISNLVPKNCVSLHNRFLRNDMSKARKEFQELLQIMSLYRGLDHPGPLKEILGLIGWPVGFARSPAARLTAQKRERAIEALDKLDLLG